MNTRIPDADGTHRLGGLDSEPAGGIPDQVVDELARRMDAGEARPDFLAIAGEDIRAGAFVSLGRDGRLLEAGDREPEPPAPHWLAEVDRMVEENVPDRDELVALITREARAAYDAGVDDTERRLAPPPVLTIPDHLVAPRAHLRVEVDPPVSYFAPATADPAVHRYPHQVTVTREELGDVPAGDLADQVKREGGSPVRAYLLRHLQEAQDELRVREVTEVDATTDRVYAGHRVATIVQALADLDELEQDRGRMAKLIVGPEVSPHD